MDPKTRIGTPPPQTEPDAAEKDQEKDQEKDDERLDEELDETFPASDPIPFQHDAGRPTIQSSA